MVEPWACVEDSYATKERTTLKTVGNMLVVVDREIAQKVFLVFIGRYGKPGQITLVAKSKILRDIGIEIVNKDEISGLEDVAFDYTALMAPVPQLAAQAVTESSENGIIIIFAWTRKSLQFVKAEDILEN